MGQQNPRFPWKLVFMEEDDSLSNSNDKHGEPRVPTERRLINSSARKTTTATMTLSYQLESS
ncbi:hypothetical protein N7449_007264 [Penicillium cf. viridicatum]|uniref:Uncharacterized protein n=1 Tax=Penicillium cf. viridicatum TaxID=2972119 RepID=A0A9W9JKW7_9EURO|nr:hypothetical protein N7449_007264 [Penicillium cf. viridicatum]